MVFNITEPVPTDSQKLKSISKFQRGIDLASRSYRATVVQQAYILRWFRQKSQGHEGAIHPTYQIIREQNVRKNELPYS